MTTKKEMFLKEFGDAYGYVNSSNSVDNIRATEFKRLEQKGIVYLDHAGATLYSELQTENIFKDLASTIYGNPHSQSDSSLATAEIISEAREMTMKFCNASPEDYRCIFTSGATAALKLVGESFPWSNSSTFFYTTENHNSVLGIREYALNQGASSVAVDVQESGDGLFSISRRPPQFRDNHEEGQRFDDEAFSLFAFPSECNFSGLRFSMDLVNFAKGNLGNRCFVLVDGAKGSATQSPDLYKYNVDFFVLSFYKLFGYPTGLGALILRNDAGKLLKNKYFGGGTVSASLADFDFVRRRERIEEAFEHGSVSFLSIASILHGLKILNRLTSPAISRHVTTLTTYTKRALLNLRHPNGRPVVILYSPPESKSCTGTTGSIVTFNLKRDDESWIGHREVEKLANLSGIQLRTGCFCNPGACAKFLHLSHNEVISNLEAGHVCWDDDDIINEKPTGAVRISFGYMSIFEDVQRFLDFVSSSFLSSTNQALPARQSPLSSAGYHLSAITVYPVKSCGGFNVQRWPLCRTGLLHDREWMVRSASGETLTQKKVPEMGFISTFIDLEKNTLVLESHRCESRLCIPLDDDATKTTRTDANAWFSTALGRSCVISRLTDAYSNGCTNPRRCGQTSSVLSFVNEAQFLMVSEASVADLNTRIVERNGGNGWVDVSRFRPNLVVSGGTAYDEDRWKNVVIGNAVLSVESF